MAALSPKELKTALYFYLSVVLVPLGVLFNAITIGVFMDKKLVKSSTGFLLLVLSSCDIVSLIWTVVIYKYMPLVGVDWSKTNAVSCYTFIFFSRSVQAVPSFVQVFISIDLYLKIAYPHRPSLSARSRRSIGVVLACAVAGIFLANIENAFRRFEVTATTVVRNSTNQTVYTRQCSALSFELTMLADFISAMMRTVCPLITMAIFNYLILRTLVKSNKRLRIPSQINLLNSKSKSLLLRRHLATIGRRKESSFSRSVVLSNFLFFVFNFPLAVTYLLQMSDYRYKSQEEINRIDMAHTITNLVSYIYDSGPFFVNLFFNRLFRCRVRQLLKLLENKSLGFKKLYSRLRKSSARVLPMSN